MLLSIASKTNMVTSFLKLWLNLSDLCITWRCASHLSDVIDLLRKEGLAVASSTLNIAFFINANFKFWLFIFGTAVDFLLDRCIDGYFCARIGANPPLIQAFHLWLKSENWTFQQQTFWDEAFTQFSHMPCLSSKTYLCLLFYREWNMDYIAIIHQIFAGFNLRPVPRAD